MCDYSLESYRSRPAQQGEIYQTHRFQSGSIGFVAPGGMSTAICMACDVTLRLEGIPQAVQSTHSVTANEDATFIHLETGSYHDGVRFTNGAEAILQQFGPGVKAIVTDDLLTPRKETEKVLMA